MMSTVLWGILVNVVDEEPYENAVPYRGLLHFLNLIHVLMIVRGIRTS